MAKKAKKSVKSKAKSAKSKTKAKKAGLVKRELTMLDKLPKDRGEWLELVIKLTERTINPHSKDCAMKAQKERLEAELAAFRASK